LITSSLRGSPRQDTHLNLTNVVYNKYLLIHLNVKLFYLRKHNDVKATREAASDHRVFASLGLDKVSVERTTSKLESRLKS
jgi:hypothetical protein